MTNIQMVKLKKKKIETEPTARLPNTGFVWTNSEKIPSKILVSAKTSSFGIQWIPHLSSLVSDENVHLTFSAIFPPSHFLMRSGP